MKIRPLFIFSWVALLAILVGCSTSSDLASDSFIKKRRYNKGFHVDLRANSKAKASSNKTIEANHQTLSSPSSHEIEGLASVDRNRIVEPASERKQNVNSPKNTLVAQADVSENIVEPFESRKERRELARQAKERYKSLNSPPAASDDISLVLYIILAILLPPLAVGLLYGIGTEFWISLILTLLFWIPGVIYALIKVLGY